MARADMIVGVTSNSGLQYGGGGTSYLVKHQGDGTLYLFFVDTASDLQLMISYNGGFTWTGPFAVFAGGVVAFALWYERWSGISGDIIHLAYTDDASDDILYRQFDPSTENFGTETVVFSGTTTGANGSLSITLTRDGRIIVAGAIDNGAEDGAWSSTDDGATWGDTIADPSEGGSADEYFLLPGWNSDTADAMLVFVDASANGLSLKRYDDSGDTWSESTIIADGSFADLAPGSGFPHVACVVDVTNTRNIVVAWTAVDTANADLRCFILTDGAITETATNVVLNSGDDQAFAAIGIDDNTGDWYVFYAGKSDGSETFAGALRLYYKVSTDDGATWGDETLLTTPANVARGILWLVCTPHFATDFQVAYYSDRSVNDVIMVNAPIPEAGGGGLVVPMFSGGVI